MFMSSAGNRLSLFYFFLAFFPLAARAETFAGWAESRTYQVPQIEVKTIDTQIPAVLLMQLQSEQKKNIAVQPEKKKPNQAVVPARQTARNLSYGFELVRSLQPNTMEEAMADNTGSKDWDKEGQKKPDQKKPDLNQDSDQDSENK